jgi:D-glycerate 3-kinase
LVIFEGWMNGFYHLAPSKLKERWLEAKDDPVRWAGENLDYPAPAFFLSHREPDLQEVNELLKQYVHTVWKYIDCFVQLSPVDMSYVWKWRLQVSGDCVPPILPPLRWAADLLWFLLCSKSTR